MKLLSLDTLKKIASKELSPTTVKITLDSISIQLLRNKLRIPKLAKGFKFRRREKVIALYSLGVKLEEVQTVTGLSKSGVRRILNDYPPSLWHEVKLQEDDPIYLKLKVLVEDAEKQGITAPSLCQSFKDILKDRE